MKLLRLIAIMVFAGVSSDGVSVVPAATLSQIAANGVTGRVFLTAPGVQAVESRRVSDGSVEIHDAWMDATYVQSGRATLVTGGQVSGPSSLSGPGEHRGGRIAGGTPHVLATGDFVLVPAGTPHQFLVARGDSIRYLTIKVPRH